MKNLSYDCNDNERYESNCCSLVEFAGKSDTSLIFKALELLESGSRNSGSSSRASAGALTRADHAAVSDAHSLNFIGMNGSTVISTGSLSGKSMDFLTTGFVDDIHSEARIDFLDVMPSHGYGRQRIDNRQPLIKEDNFGMNEDQVKDCAQNQAPCNAGKSAAEAIIDNIDVTQSADRKKCAKSHDVTTSRSEGFGVGHVAILSRNERRAA